MYYLGSVEFNQYLYAEDRLAELIKEQELSIRRAYADIHPTRVMYNVAEGRAYSESISVVDYAIWLIETKDLQKEQRLEFTRHAKIIREALTDFTTEEILLIEDYKVNTPGLNQGKVFAVLSKLRKVLENILGAKEVVKCKT